MAGQRQPQYKPGQRGITRLELVIIAVILCILGLVVAEQLSRRLNQARHEQVSSDLERIAAALHQYKLDNKRYPTAAQGLPALLTSPQTKPLAKHWDGPYLSRPTLLQDPWGRPYRYRSEFAPPSFELESLGADGKEGGDGSSADILLRYQSADGQR